MRSILFLLSAHGALGECSGSECHAEEIAMLQHRRPSVRLAPVKTQSQALLETMRGVANSLTEGSDATMTPDQVNEALETAHEALAELSPAIRQQVENAQSQINHAHAAVQACHAEDQASLRASLHSSAAQYAAAVESCEATHETLRQEEQEACDRAEDCLCDEARVRTTDQEALCASRTETYEVAWCEHHNVCNIFRNCHDDEAQVYRELRADVEAEMATVVQEYVTVEQSACLTNLIMAAMTPPLTPITTEALIACDDVDVSGLSVTYPDLPAEPAECPAPAVGAPECSAWDLIVHHEVSAGWFPGSVRNSLTHNADDPSASLFMNVGQLTSGDYLADGSYHFRLVFHDVSQGHAPCNDGPALSGDQEFEWTQSSWISESSVTGYEPISPADLAASPHPGCVFNGLARSSTSATVFDGSPSHGNWFHSVGSTQVWHGGIPAFKGGSAQGVSLYVQKAGYSHHDWQVVNHECPTGWEQVGEDGADIGGCGLQSCGERYWSNNPSECADACADRADCLGFNWAPMGGDRNHEAMTVCTLYNADTPTSSWSGSAGEVQIFCKPEVEWTVVQGAATSPHAGVNLGADAFNTMFAACPVVRYTNPSMSGSPAVYKRHSGAYPGNAHTLFTHLWARQNNQFHSDFDIYPSAADARAGTNAWTFCNFSDEPQPNHFTVGFPRDCGPTGYQPHIWFHATRAHGLQTQGYFEIYTGSDCPAAASD